MKGTAKRINKEKKRTLRPWAEVAEIMSKKEGRRIDKQTIKKDCIKILKKMRRVFNELNWTPEE